MADTFIKELLSDEGFFNFFACMSLNLCNKSSSSIIVIRVVISSNLDEFFVIYPNFQITSKLAREQFSIEVPNF